MTDTGQNRSGGHGRTAAKGMAWVALSLVIVKLLSFGSQIILGHVLAVETYATFAIVTAASVFVAGFQNAGISQALIQRQNEFDNLLPQYSAFALYFGVIGGVLFLIVGAYFQIIYDLNGLFLVITVSSLSIPLVAINTIYVARLSIRYQFRAINLIDIVKSLFYYVALILGAIVGLEIFTVACAAMVGALAHLFLLARRVPEVRIARRLSLRAFWSIAHTLRWVIFSSFLVALAMNADYLVLGKLLSKEELGYYFFGFLVVTNLTILMSAGINQTLLPIFSRINNDLVEIRRQFVRMSGAIGTVMGLLCIGIVGIGPAAVHWIWGGKWDGAQIVIISIAATLPIRLLATVAGVGFQARGAWSVRAAILLIEALVLVICALAGATWGGLPGAAIAVAGQRAVSGLLAFPIFSSLLGLGIGHSVKFVVRLIGPYVLSISLLFLMEPSRHGQIDSVAMAAQTIGETILAIAVFLIGTFLFNRDLVKALILLIVSWGRP